MVLGWNKVWYLETVIIILPDKISHKDRTRYDFMSEFVLIIVIENVNANAELPIRCFMSVR